MTHLGTINGEWQGSTLKKDISTLLFCTRPETFLSGQIHCNSQSYDYKKFRFPRRTPYQVIQVDRRSQSFLWEYPSCRACKILHQRDRGWQSAYRQSEGKDIWYEEMRASRVHKCMENIIKTLWSLFTNQHIWWPSNPWWIKYLLNTKTVMSEAYIVKISTI